MTRPLILDRRVAAHHALADVQFHRVRQSGQWPQSRHECRGKSDFQRAILELFENVPRGFFHGPTERHGEVTFTRLRWFDESGVDHGDFDAFRGEINAPGLKKVT
ncbi:hypothetical protein D9M69_730740 [compost metagenome]